MLLVADKGSALFLGAGILQDSAPVPGWIGAPLTPSQVAHHCQPAAPTISRPKVPGA